MKGKIIEILAVLGFGACFAMAEEKAWDVSASLGLNMTRGNSETVTLTPEMKASGKFGANEMKMSASYSYGETSDEITERKAKGTAQYNRLLTERVYAYANGEISYDDLANINYRAIVGPGLGYYLLKSDKKNLSFEAGASWITEEVEIETEPDVFDKETSSETAVRLAQKFDVKIGQNAKLWETLEYLPQVDDFDIYLLNAEVGVEAAVNNSLSLRTTINNAHNSDPVPGKEKDDTTVKAALVYKFGRKN